MSDMFDVDDKAVRPRSCMRLRERAPPRECRSLRVLQQRVRDCGPTRALDRRCVDRAGRPVCRRPCLRRHRLFSANRDVR